MGNLVTKITTNSVELNESDASDVVYSQVEKSPTPSGQQQTRTGLFKNILGFDPRSPSAFITRTPIAVFRNNSASKFSHKELNESIESQVDLDILTPEEEESLASGGIAETAVDETEMLPDPRSPITELVRTPIIAADEAKKRKDDNLVKKLAEKLMSANVADDESKEMEEKTTKKAKKTKNLIYEDDENDRYSTPPKKVTAVLREGPMTTRTPLSCVANTNTPRSRIPTSTPKSKTFNADFERSSRIPVSSVRKLH